MKDTEKRLPEIPNEVDFMEMAEAEWATIQKENRLLNNNAKYKAIYDTFCQQYFQPSIVENSVSEVQDMVELMLRSNQNFDFVAEPGSGKTSVFLETALANAYPLIMIFPLVAQVKQWEHRFADRFKGKILAVLKGVTRSNIKSHLKHGNVIVSTYDSLQKICDALGHESKKYTLIIDEYHNLVIQHDFRRGAMRRVSDVLSAEKFKNVIKITGTPEGIFPKNPTYGPKISVKENAKSESAEIQISRSMATYKTRKKQVAVSKDVTQVGSYKIIRYRRNMLEKVADHIVSSCHGGKVVVLIDRISKIKKLEQLLKEKLGTLKGNQIAKLHRNRTNNETYRSIIEKGTVPSKCSILITTTIICDGVNIENSDISAVYLLNFDNPILIRQFLARYRKSAPLCYDFTPHNSNCLRKSFDIDADVRDYAKNLTPVVELMNKMTLEDKDNRGIALTRLFGTKEQNISSIFFNKTSDQYEIDELGIRHSVLSYVHDKIMRDKEGRRLILELFGQFHVTEMLLADDDKLNTKTKNAIMVETLRLMGYSEDETGLLTLKHGTTLKRLFRRLSYLYYLHKKRSVPQDIIKRLQKLDMNMDWKIMDLISSYVKDKKVFSPGALHAFVVNELAATVHHKISQKNTSAIAGDVFVLKDSNRRTEVNGSMVGNNCEVVSKMTKNYAIRSFSQV